MENLPLVTIEVRVVAVMGSSVEFMLVLGAIVAVVMGSSVELEFVFVVGAIMASSNMGAA